VALARVIIATYSAEARSKATGPMRKAFNDAVLSFKTDLTEAFV